MQPVRIQRKRIKGWRMPENTVSVTRPGKWGNPFKIGKYYAIGSLGFLEPVCKESIERAKSDSKYTFVKDAETAVELYRKYMEGLRLPDTEGLKKLKGKNLACFCKEGQVCHADVLLKLANQ